MNSWTPISLAELRLETKETELEALGHYVSRLHTGAKGREWADKLAKLDVDCELEELQAFLKSLEWRVRVYRAVYEFDA